MGIIRILLALSVLITHSNFAGKVFVPGDIAVQLFFIISGFYIAMILNEKYKNNIIGFYKNRFLRLYPIYIVVFLITICASFLAKGAFNVSYGSLYTLTDSLKNNDLNFASLVIIVISNLTLLFQDVLLFTTIQNGQIMLELSSLGKVIIHKFMIIPQAWSLSLEIFFYTIAPFIVLNRNRALLVFFISFGIKVFLFTLGFREDPYTYRFFMSEISVFMLGVIMYHLYNEQIYSCLKKVIPIIIFGFLLILIFWNKIFQFDILNRYVFFIVFSAGIPYIFQYFKNNKIDRAVGELSYPFYLVHLSCLQISSIIMRKIKIENYFTEYLVVCISIIISLMVSMMLIIFVQNKIEVIRRKNYKNRKKV